MGKIYILFPHKGIILETECSGTDTVFDLLEYLKNRTIKDVENFCRDQNISGEILNTVKEIYKDLNSMDVDFSTG